MLIYYPTKTFLNERILGDYYACQDLLYLCVSLYHSLQMLQQPHKKVYSDNIHSSGYCKIFLINVELDKKILSLILKESNFVYDSDYGYTFPYYGSGVVG